MSSPSMRSGFIFLDETGKLPVAHERFFAVGIVKCPEPAVIQRPMQTLRDKRHFWKEMKWYETKPQTLDIYKRAVDCFFGCHEALFACFIADKTAKDPIKRFGNQWKAYEGLAVQLLVGTIGHDELMAVLADELSTPPGVTFEENVRADVESRLGRKAITGICRMRSTGCDLFQILDLLLGAVAYDHKLDAGIVAPGPKSAKVKLLEYIKGQFGVTTFVGGVRAKHINVEKYGSPLRLSSATTPTGARQIPVSTKTRP